MIAAVAVLSSGEFWGGVLVGALVMVGLGALAGGLMSEPAPPKPPSKGVVRGAGDPEKPRRSKPRARRRK